MKTFIEWLLQENFQIKWIPPPPGEDPFDTFGRAVQLLSEGEFKGLIDPKMQGTPLPEAKKIYDELQGYSEFKKYSHTQSDTANCLAGQSFQKGMSYGKLEPQSDWNIVFKSSPSDINFTKIFEEINKIPATNMEVRLDNANKISNNTTNEGETRDLKGLAQKMLAGSDFIAPKIYKGTNKFTFIGGKTRVLACMAINSIPSLYIIDRNAVAKAIQMLLPQYSSQGSNQV